MSTAFHPEAQRELFEAVAYYDSIDIDLGDRFVASVEQALQRIDRLPQAWAKLSENSRRCRVSNFPYGVIYQITSQGIWIVAFMHLQRKPDYWNDRL